VTPQSFAVVKPRSHARSLIDLSKLDAHQSANTPDGYTRVSQCNRSHVSVFLCAGDVTRGVVAANSSDVARSFNFCYEFQVKLHSFA